MEKKGVYLVFIMVMAGWLTLGSQPADVDARSKVSAVTVYPDRAMVTRQWRHLFQPGLYTLNFSHLPVGLINRSVRVAGRGSAEAVILNVKVERDRLTAAFDQEMRDLEVEKGGMEEQILQLNDRLKALKKREHFLVSLSEKTIEAVSKSEKITHISLSEHEQNLDFLESQLNKVYKQQRQLEKEQQKLRGRADAIEAKINKSRQKGNKEEKKIMVDIEVKKGGNLQVEASYMMREASWTPTYDFRFTSTGRGASLRYGARVQQRTGEDWKNVRLTLSTARLMVYRSVPDLKPQYLNEPSGGTGIIRGLVQLVDGGPIPGVAVELSRHGRIWKRTVTDENGKFLFPAVPAGSYDLRCTLESFKPARLKNLLVYGNKITLPEIVMETGTIQQEIVISGSSPIIDVRKSDTSYIFDRRFRAPNVYGGGSGGGSYSGGSGSGKSKASYSLNDLAKKLGVEESFMKSQGISTTFSLKHRETVLSASRFQKVTIFMDRLNVELEHLAIPKLSDFAFLKARVTNSNRIPLLAGRVDLFYDGAFVNTAHIDFKNPGETFELPVGVDETIRLERKALEIKSRNKGLFKNRRERQLGYTIKVKSFKKHPTMLTVLDQIPVSKDKKVKVITTSIIPAAKKFDEEKDNGIRKWRLQLPPGVEKWIKVRYRVTSPKDHVIKEGD